MTEEQLETAYESILLLKDFYLARAQEHFAAHSLGGTHRFKQSLKCIEILEFHELQNARLSFERRQK
jgi:hypothetical protein